jgi:hypothetical protein
MARVPQLSVVGLGIAVFGGILALGLLQFPQLSFCAGFVVFGACVGAYYNYSWAAGLVLVVVGLVWFAVTRAGSR